MSDHDPPATVPHATESSRRSRAVLRPWRWPLSWQAGALSCTLIGAAAVSLLLEERRWLLPGSTSDGHHVIESACGACHGGFAAPDNASCAECHRAELAADTHPVAVFGDPRWLAELSRIDARRCIACHAEHARNERGVSAPRDFCFGCHEDVVTKRATHRSFDPASCMSGGCHNYHDNRTLSAAYIEKRLGKRATHRRTPRLRLGAASAAAPARVPATAGPAPAPRQPTALERQQAIERLWSQSAHARENVDCARCHGEGDGWVARPDQAVCASCHAFEARTFGRGKHGARQALGLLPLRGEHARRPMRAQAAGAELNCGACHDPHALDLAQAAANACLGCHDDAHSSAFPRSSHAAAGVTCATCHLPRVEVEAPKAPGQKRVAVHHNNSFTLQPRDRMARMVCVDCHSIELSLSALFDEDSVRSNFAHAPGVAHPTIDMVRATLTR